MALRVGIRNAAGVVTEVNVRSLTTDTKMGAEEGKSEAWQLQVDDPTGALTVGGHRAVVVYEDATTDTLKQYITSGYTQKRHYARGDLIEGMGTAGRVITVDVADLNTILGRRVFSEADTGAIRPAETDVARFTWATQTVEAALIADARYLMTTNPVDMDIADYRGQYLLDVLEDCAEAGGKNYFTTGFQTGAIATMAGADAATVISIAYFPTSDYTTWPSGCRLTNVAADVDDVTTFIVESADLTQDPGRVKSGSLMPFDGGEDYSELAATATEFARIDTISPAANVKTAAKALARNLRILNDLNTEELRLDITFNMRPAQVNLIRAGMVVNGQFDHLAPEMGSGYVPMRMLDRKVIQSPDTGFGFYKLSGTFALEVPVAVAPGIVQSKQGLWQLNGIHTVTFDDPIEEGATMVAFLFTEDGLSSVTTAGWTRLVAGTCDAGTQGLEIWTKVAGISEPQAVATSADSGGISKALHIFAVRGAVDVSGGVSNGAITASLAGPTLTPAGDPGVLLAAYYGRTKTYTGPAVFAPTGDLVLDYFERHSPGRGHAWSGHQGTTTGAYTPTVDQVGLDTGQTIRVAVVVT